MIEEFHVTFLYLVILLFFKSNKSFLEATVRIFKFWQNYCVALNKCPSSVSQIAGILAVL